MSRPIILPKIANPDFSFPGRKPIGPVEIDLSNPINRGLRGLFLLNNEGYVDLVSGKSGSKSGNGRVVGTPDGMAYEQSQDSYVLLPLKALGTRNITVMGRCSYRTLSQDQALFDINNQEFVLWADTYQSQLRAAAFAGSVHSGTTGGLGISANGNRFFTWGSQVRDTGGAAEAQLWIDGAIDASYSGIGTADYTSSADIRIGNNQQLNKDTDGFISFVLVWARTLSDFEFRSVSMDPYQLLKPANAPVYFISAATGVSGTASVSSVTGTTTTGSKQGSGTSSVSSTSAATSQGSKDISGTASESAITATTESGTKEASSSSSVSAVTNTASTGTSGLSGSASVSAASSTTETGTKDTTGTAQSTASSSASVSASKAASGVSSVSSTTTTTATGTASEGIIGTASVSSATGTTSTGKKAASDSASATSATGSTATATKSASSDVSVSAASSTSATGTVVETRSGTASVSASSNSISSGSKSSTGDSLVSSSSDTTTVSTTNRVGISSVSVSSSVAFQAFKAITDGLFVSSTTNVSASGIKQITGESTSNITSKQIVTIVDDAVIAISVNDEAIIVNV